jgi:very-short-patch-repair endonuclease
MPWNKPPDHTVSVRATVNAKELRRCTTEPEKRLWRHLRHRLPLQASHFRRQVAVGPYVVDFCCYPARLVVEVDGNQHGRDDAIARDAPRTAYLEKHGFRILRFSNRDVMREIDVVLDTVHAALAVPTPTPSPQGGGERGRILGQTVRMVRE